MSSLARVGEIVREQFGDPNIEVTAKTTSYDVDGWDSLSHAGLIITIERAFGVKIPLDKALSFESIGELVDWLDRNAAI